MYNWFSRLKENNLNFDVLIKENISKKIPPEALKLIAAGRKDFR